MEPIRFKDMEAMRAVMPWPCYNMVAYTMYQRHPKRAHLAKDIMSALCINEREVSFNMALAVEKGYLAMEPMAESWMDPADVVVVNNVYVEDIAGLEDAVAVHFLRRRHRRFGMSAEIRSRSEEYINNQRWPAVCATSI